MQWNFFHFLIDLLEQPKKHYLQAFLKSPKNSWHFALVVSQGADPPPPRCTFLEKMVSIVLLIRDYPQTQNNQRKLWERFTIKCQQAKILLMVILQKFRMTEKGPKKKHANIREKTCAILHFENGKDLLQNLKTAWAPQ